MRELYSTVNTTAIRHHLNLGHDLRALAPAWRPPNHLIPPSVPIIVALRAGW